MESAHPSPSGKKNRALKIVGITLAALLLVVGAALAIGYLYLDSQITEGEAGQLTSEVRTTAPAIKQRVVHYLICGIDYDAQDDGRSYGAGLGMTDVILYVTLDLEAQQVNVLQIPRDTYVGEDAPTGGTCKINSVYSHGPDEVNRISNLAGLISEQFGLPVDHYMTINMEMFKQIFITLGGLEMYVPWDVTDDEGNIITQGTHKLDANHIEWILRQRKGYETGDLKRLELQQYFYRAMFATFKTFPMTDVIKVLPAFITYVNTDLSVADLISLAGTVMGIDSAQIGFARCPGGSINRLNTVSGNIESCYGINVENLADLLNRYYRPHEEPVPAAQLGLPVIPEEDFTLGQLNDDLRQLSGLEVQGEAT